MGRSSEEIVGYRRHLLDCSRVPVNAHQKKIRLRIFHIKKLFISHHLYHTWCCSDFPKTTSTCHGSVIVYSWGFIMSNCFDHQSTPSQLRHKKEPQEPGGYGGSLMPHSESFVLRWLSQAISQPLLLSSQQVHDTPPLVRHML